MIDRYETEREREIFEKNMGHEMMFYVYAFIDMYMCVIMHAHM